MIVETPDQRSYALPDGQTTEQLCDQLFKNKQHGCGIRQRRLGGPAEIHRHYRPDWLDRFLNPSQCLIDPSEQQWSKAARQFRPRQPQYVADGSQTETIEPIVRRCIEPQGCDRTPG